jgi:hypothetical protein
VVFVGGTIKSKEMHMTPIGFVCFDNCIKVHVKMNEFPCGVIFQKGFEFVF